ncbi:MAG TPA: hypothetical protein VGI22_06300 [Xanthobacteraceae bacterium]
MEQKHHFTASLWRFLSIGLSAEVTLNRSSGPARSTSIGRNVALIVTVLLTLICGTLAAVKMTTDYLLYQRATSDARSWARFMAKSLSDLEPIAAGEPPSAASMSFFQWAQKSDQVFRYEIFNREGYSQLTADQRKIALLTLSEYSAAAARAGKTGRPVVEAMEGNPTELPSFYAAPMSRCWSTRSRSPSSRPMWTRPRSATGSTAPSCLLPYRSACCRRCASGSRPSRSTVAPRKSSTATAASAFSPITTR